MATSTSIIIILAILTILMPMASTTASALASTSGRDISSLRGASRLLDQYNVPSRAAGMTCDKFPRVCRAKGSSGPDCCKKQCVNVTTDTLNCGACGNKCRYGEACCGGTCVNVTFDQKNCGSCKNRCEKGNVCKYGMCSYS